MAPISISGRKIQMIAVDPTPPVSEIDSIINPLVDHRFVAVNTKNISGTAAASGQNAYSMPDSVGSRNLEYSGGTPPLYGRQPQFFKQYGILANLEGVARPLDMVFMDNQVAIQFSDPDLRTIDFPRVKGRVWYQPEYFLYEAYDNNTYRPYFGENSKNYNTGITTLRFTTGEPWNDYLVVLPTNTLNYLYQEFIEDGEETSPSRVSVKTWLNGVLLDPDNHHETYRRQPLTEGFGTDSNCAMHGFVENFDIYGRTLSSSDRDNIWIAIRDYYRIGEEIDAPVANNVEIHNYEGVIKGEYDYHSKTGHAEDVSGRECYWISYESGGGIQSGEVVSALNNVTSFNLADYSDKFSGGIRFNVRVKDSVTGYTNYLPGVEYRGSVPSDEGPDPDPDPPDLVDNDPFFDTVNEANRVSGTVPVTAFDAYMLSDANGSLEGLFDGNLDGNSPGDGILYYGGLYIDLRKHSANVNRVEITNNPYDQGGVANIYLIERGTWTKTLIGTYDGDAHAGQHNVKFTYNAPDGNFASTYLIFEGDPILFAEISVIGSYIPYTPTVVVREKVPLRTKLGANTFVWNFYNNENGGGKDSTISEGRMNVIESLGMIRDYIEWNRLEMEEQSYSFNPTRAGGFDFDTVYERCKAEGIDVLACVKEVPSWIQDTWPEEYRNNEMTPVKWNTDYNTTIASFSLPQSYIAYARMGFQFAARYGYNTSVDPDLVSVYTSENPWEVNDKKIGLGYIKYFEVDNERDKWWKGRQSYQSAREYAAMLSAFYDGHKNTMGLGVGIKNADPSIIIVMMGTALNSPNYVKGMIDWCREHRGYLENGEVNLCWDIINYHEYSNDGESQSGNPTMGMAPELTYTATTADEFNRVANEMVYGQEVWNTEVGFDLNQGSIQHAPSIGSKAPNVVQADWLLRTALLYSWKGIERMVVYMLPDVGDDPGRFATSGIWDSSGDTAVARPSANYFKQVKNLMGDYMFDSRLNGDPIIDKYTLDGEGDIYACWIPDEIGRTGNYNLPLPSGTAIKKYTLNPDSSAITEQSITTSGTSYTVACSETPIFIKIL